MCLSIVRPRPQRSSQAEGLALHGANVIYVLIVLGVVAIGTFIYSIYGLLADELVVRDQMYWKPTYPWIENYKSRSYFDIRKGRE